MVLTVSFALSPVIGLVCHRCRPRCASIVASLMPASRHQDHTTSPSATGALVFRAHRVHRIPHPTFVTLAIRPSSRGGTRKPWSVSGESNKRDGCGRLARRAIFAWQASALTYPRDMFPVMARHNRSKNGVASARLCPGHPRLYPRRRPVIALRGGASDEAIQTILPLASWIASLRSQ